MNKIKRSDFTQEITAAIRAAKNENDLRPLLKRYHPRDVAKAASQLTGRAEAAAFSTGCTDADGDFPLS